MAPCGVSDHYQCYRAVLLSSFEWVHKLQPKRYRDKLKLYTSRREAINHCVNISKTV